MKIPRIAITAVASFSPLGYGSEAVWQNYLRPSSLIRTKEIGGVESPVATIPEALEKTLSEVKASDPKYRSLDRSVLYAILASREAVSKSGWGRLEDVFGINMGSSRGATELFEKYHSEFLQTGRTSSLSSPSTTLGNISSWVAHDLKTKGPEISHSITCSTALHSLLNAAAWINSGMSDRFLLGGSEAPLTAFTMAQMKALRIYAEPQAENDNVICRSLDLEKDRNTLVLGEAAVAICLEKDAQERALAHVEGLGYATEILKHGSSISAEAECLQRSMRMALENTPYDEVDVIVTHAPGTILGDLSEYRAIEKLFGENIPAITGNKWKIGHSFGASGGMSLELAILMLQHQKFIPIPFCAKSNPPKRLKKILVNAVGFGGNAVSVLVSQNGARIA